MRFAGQFRWLACCTAAFRRLLRTVAALFAASFCVSTAFAACPNDYGCMVQGSTSNLSRSGPQASAQYRYGNQTGIIYSSPQPYQRLQPFYPTSPLQNPSSNPYDPNSVSSPYSRFNNPYLPGQKSDPYGAYNNPYASKGLANPYGVHRNPYMPKNIIDATKPDAKQNPPAPVEQDSGSSESGLAPNDPAAKYLRFANPGRPPKSLAEYYTRYRLQAEGDGANQQRSVEDPFSPEYGRGSADAESPRRDGSGGDGTDGSALRNPFNGEAPRSGR